MATPAYRAPVGLRRLRGGPLLRLRSDDQLLALFRAGSDDAFQVLHDRYRQRLFIYARQMLGGSQADAEDAMQDVFLRAYGALRADDRPVSVRAWLYRVAHNRCIDQLRRPRPATVELLEDTATSRLLEPMAQAQQSEDLARLLCDVGRLPEQQRSALLLREMEGLTYLELAAALDCSVPAVKSLLVRARMGLIEQAEARALSCADIRDDLDQAHDRGVRMTGRARRHLRDCPACRSYRDTLKGVSSGLHSLGAGSPAGPWPLVAKLFGLGSAGSGAAAGGAAVGGAAGGGGVALIGGGAAATASKVAAIVCCAAVVGGGAAEVQHRITPPERHAAKAERPEVTRAVAQPPSTPAVHALDRTGPRPELASSTATRRRSSRVAEHRAAPAEPGLPATPIAPPGPDGLVDLPEPLPTPGEIAGGVEAPEEPIIVGDPETTPTTAGSDTTSTTTQDPGDGGGSSSPEPARDTGAPTGAATPAPGAGGAPTPGSSSAGTPQ